MTHDERIVFRLGCEESILHDTVLHVDSCLERLRELDGLGFLHGMREAVDELQIAKQHIDVAYRRAVEAKRAFMEGDG